MEKTSVSIASDRSEAFGVVYKKKQSVVPRPMSVVFGLETRLRVRMCTKLENGVLHNETATTECCEWLY